MRNKAARKRTFSSLAALPLPQHDHFPHPAGLRSSLKLATGLSTFPIRSNITVSKHLAAKMRWSVVYSYRARWYLPEAGVFVERDPVKAGAAASLYVPLGYNPACHRDPQGLFPSSEVTYETYTGEGIRASHIELTKRGLLTSGRDVDFYWYHRYLRFRFGVAQSVVYEENTVMERMTAVARKEHGWGYDRSWTIGTTGDEVYREVIFGVPDLALSKKMNRVLQRIRLFQVETIIDRFVDEWPDIMKSDPYKLPTELDVDANYEFDKRFAKAHREATRAVVANWSKFAVKDTKIAARVLAALFSSVYILTPDIMRHGTLVGYDTWVKHHYGWGSYAVEDYPGRPIFVSLEH